MQPSPVPLRRQRGDASGLSPGRLRSTASLLRHSHKLTQAVDRAHTVAKINAQRKGLLLYKSDKYSFRASPSIPTRGPCNHIGGTYSSTLTSHTLHTLLTLLSPDSRQYSPKCRDHRPDTRSTKASASPPGPPKTTLSSRPNTRAGRLMLETTRASRLNRYREGLEFWILKWA